MNTLMKTFFKGLFAFLPVFLTVYAVYALSIWLNRIASQLLAWIAPEVPDVPGLGVVIGCLLIFGLGVLVSLRLTRWIYNLMENLLQHLPVVRDVYSALKQLTALLAPAEGDDTGQVVSVKWPDAPLRLVGLLMRSDVSDLDDAIAGDGMVAVYLPMSYQVGGYTVFVPREWVTRVDMKVDTAMRNALTGWVKGEARKKAAKST